LTHYPTVYGPISDIHAAIFLAGGRSAGHRGDVLNEDQKIGRVKMHLAYRWFCKLDLDDAIRPPRAFRREHALEVVQKRLDKNLQAMRQRRETVEHPFATLKMRMGATHLLMKRLPKVATEMALHVLAYNLTRVMNIMGIQPLMAAIRA
jgi:hypothetical protein